MTGNEFGELVRVDECMNSKSDSNYGDDLWQLVSSAPTTDRAIKEPAMTTKCIPEKPASRQ